MSVDLFITGICKPAFGPGLE